MVSVQNQSLDVEFSEEDDASLEKEETASFSDAVLYSSDWTVETIINQMTRRNIDMNPRFQRRDAWTPRNKSRFIESVVLGLPIPQIVLAEVREKKGQFIVLDGKQRLLSLLQFVGKGEVDGRGFALSGLEARPDLKRKRFKDLFGDDLNAFYNHTIRTVVIRNWPNFDFLHLVFLRLNTGSVRLSPQELRQAMVPGPFSDFVDDKTVDSKSLQQLLSRKNPDPRMRDVEILVRHLAFKNFLERYRGRMKSFLDSTCDWLNQDWEKSKMKVERDFVNFENCINVLGNIFGYREIARKSDSSVFNRAIFDALALYASDAKIAAAMIKNQGAIRDAYSNILTNERFQESIESDTASIGHTVDRLRIWGEALATTLQLSIDLPSIYKDADDNQRIRLGYVDAVQ